MGGGEANEAPAPGEENLHEIYFLPVILPENKKKGEKCRRKRRYAV